MQRRTVSRRIWQSPPLCSMICESIKKGDGGAGREIQSEAAGSGDGGVRICGSCPIAICQVRVSQR